MGLLRRPFGLLAMTAVLLCATLISYFRVLDNYEFETLDIRFRLRGNIPTDKNIAIIEIGDDTIDKLGKWPISRRFHATLIEALTHAGAKAIVFDIFFSEKSTEEDDRLFQEAIAKSRRVYLPYVFNLPRPGRRASRTRGVPDAEMVQEELLDGFKDSAKGTGFINIIPDTDGKFRRVPPFIRYGGILYPHLSFFVAADYLGVQREGLKLTPGKSVSFGERFKVPLDSDSTCLVNFPGKWEETFRHYSYIDIIDSYMSGQFPAILGRNTDVNLAALKGAVCFVGVTATATPDAHPTPFDSLYPGIGVHASLFNSFLSESFVKRASRLTNILILLFLCLVTYLISKRTRTLLGFVFVFLFMASFVAVGAAFFVAFGLWLDIFSPVTIVLFFYLGVTFAKYITEMQKRELLEKELSIAREIQESFLPKGKPAVSGIDVEAKMSTARQVGGDLYDFINIGQNRLGIMIGDVSGKGVPAALFMAKVVSEFKTYAAEDTACGAILKLNERLCKEASSGLFVTLSYVIFDTDARAASYSSGGHLPMIMVKAGSSEPGFVDLKEGMPLGLSEGSFSEEKIAFVRGDTFILYTDGVTEATNSKGEMFGQERLARLIGDNSNLGAGELVGLIQNEVKKFEHRREQHDDVTVVVVRT